MTTKPTEQQLTEAQVDEIGARAWVFAMNMGERVRRVLLSPAERDALIRDWRAMKAQIDEFELHRPGIIEAVQTAEARVDELESDNAALREQLANVTKERNDWKQRAEEAEADLRETV